MKSRFVIAFWATMLALVFFASNVGLYRLLRVYFELSAEGALLLIVPTFLVCGFACIYGFMQGIQQIQVQGDQSSAWQGFELGFRVIVFGLLMAIPSMLSLYFLLVYQDVSLTMLFAIIAAGVAFWVVPKLIGGKLRGRC